MIFAAIVFLQFVVITVEQCVPVGILTKSYLEEQCGSKSTFGIQFKINAIDLRSVDEDAFSSVSIFDEILISNVVVNNLVLVFKSVLSVTFENCTYVPTFTVEQLAFLNLINSSNIMIDSRNRNISQLEILGNVFRFDLALLIVNGKIDYTELNKFADPTNFRLVILIDVELPSTLVLNKFTNIEKLYYKNISSNDVRLVGKHLYSVYGEDSDDKNITIYGQLQTSAEGFKFQNDKVNGIFCNTSYSYTDHVLGNMHFNLSTSTSALNGSVLTCVKPCRE